MDEAFARKEKGGPKTRAFGQTEGTGIAIFPSRKAPVPRRIFSVAKKNFPRPFIIYIVTPGLKDPSINFKARYLFLSAWFKISLFLSSTCHKNFLSNKISEVPPKFSLKTIKKNNYSKKIFHLPKIEFNLQPINRIPKTLSYK